MTNKAKQRIRATAEKTGSSYQALLNQKRAAQAAPRDPLDDIITELRATHISSVLVGKMPVRAVAATAALATEFGRSLRQNPTYFAQSEHVQRGVSKTEHDRLLERGATLYAPPSRYTQSVWLPDASSRAARSAQCATCTRWVWCGEKGDATCVCGQPITVGFDGQTVTSLPTGLRCMDCGRELSGHWPADAGRSWRAMGPNQCVCDRCDSFSYLHDSKRHVTTKPSQSSRARLRALRLAASKPFVRTLERQSVALAMVDALTILDEHRAAFRPEFTKAEAAALKAVREYRRADAPEAERLVVLRCHQESCLSVARKLGRDIQAALRDHEVGIELASFVIERAATYAWAIENGLDVEKTPIDELAKLSVSPDIVAATMVH